MHRVVFYEFHEANPTTDRYTHKSSDGDRTIVLVDDLSKVPAMAVELTDEGVGLVELCGGMPLAVRAMVKAAVPGHIGVASVTFGIESIVKAAEFNQAFMSGRPPAEACIILAPNADPHSDRFVRNSGPQNTTFIMSDEHAAAETARLLAAQGFGLIELYGGFSDDVAASVIEAVAGRAAVGLSGFGN